MFRVGTGLDSQILDFEIISQIRSSFTQSKVIGYNNFMERLVNAVIQASKKIKQIQKLVRSHFGVFCCSIYNEECRDIGNKKYSTFRTGKIGRNTCENLVKHQNEHL
jgi:glutamyl-tRNA reductase